MIFHQEQRRSVAFKSLAIGLCVSLFNSLVSVPLAQASLWQERRKAFQEYSVSQNSQDYTQFALAADAHSLSNFSAVKAQSSVFTASIPQKFSKLNISPALRGLLGGLSSDGQIVNVHHAKDLAPMVVVIQDAHGVLSVQKNIAKLISNTQKVHAKSFGAQGRFLVGVEGSSGQLRGVENLKSFPDKQVLADVSNYFLNQGFLTGVEVAGLNRSDLELYGVEDASVYLKQVRAFTDTLDQSVRVQNVLSRADQKMQAAKKAVYSKELLTLDAAKQNFENNKINLTQWISVLSAKELDLSDFKNVQLYIQASAFEKSLDSAKIQKDQQVLLKKLSDNLNSNELKNLVNYSVLYRLGKISSGDFYGRLQKEFARFNLPVSNGMQSYFKYVALVDQIDKDSLFTEVQTLEEKTFKSLALLTSALKVYELDRDLSLLSKSLDFRLSPQDWTRLNARKNILQNLQAAQILSTDSNVVDVLQNVIDFSQLSDTRSDMFVDKMLARLQGQKNAWSVLVAGGFHSEKIEALLRARGASFVVVRPNMEVADTQNALHPLDAFKRELTPLEKAFLPEKISLAPQQHLGGVSDQTSDDAVLLSLSAVSLLQGLSEEQSEYLKQQGLTWQENGVTKIEGGIKVQVQNQSGKTLVAYLLNNGSAEIKEEDGGTVIAQGTLGEKNHLVLVEDAKANWRFNSDQGWTKNFADYLRKVSQLSGWEIQQDLPDSQFITAALIKTVENLARLQASVDPLLSQIEKLGYLTIETYQQVLAIISELNWFVKRPKVNQDTTNARTELLDNLVSYYKRLFPQATFNYQVKKNGSFLFTGITEQGNNFEIQLIFSAMTTDTSLDQVGAVWQAIETTDGTKKYRVSVNRSGLEDSLVNLRILSEEFLEMTADSDGKNPDAVHEKFVKEELLRLNQLVGTSISLQEAKLDAWDLFRSLTASYRSIGRGQNSVSRYDDKTKTRVTLSYERKFSVSFESYMPISDLQEERAKFIRETILIWANQIRAYKKSSDQCKLLANDLEKKVLLEPRLYLPWHYDLTEASTFAQMAQKVRSGQLGSKDAIAQHNGIKGTISPTSADNPVIIDATQMTVAEIQRLTEKGKSKKTAPAVSAGGLSTRGVDPKTGISIFTATFRFLKGYLGRHVFGLVGRGFMDAKFQIAKDSGAPLYIMTSPVRLEAVAEAFNIPIGILKSNVSANGYSIHDADGTPVYIFVQGLQQRMVPSQAVATAAFADLIKKKQSELRSGAITQDQLDLYLQEIERGRAYLATFKPGDAVVDLNLKPEVNPPGHWDFVRYLAISGALADAKRRGLDFIMHSNMNNPAAQDHSYINGIFQDMIEKAKAAGQAVPVFMFLVGENRGEKGGLVFDVEYADGSKKTQLVEGIAMTKQGESVRATMNPQPPFNTATFLVNVDAAINFFGLNQEFYLKQETYSVEDKRRIITAVEAQTAKLSVYVDIKSARVQLPDGTWAEFPSLQFERIYGDATTIAPWIGLMINRDENFVPIKEPKDLQDQRKQDQLAKIFLAKDFLRLSAQGKQDLEKIDGFGLGTKLTPGIAFLIGQFLSINLREKVKGNRPIVWVTSSSSQERLQLRDAFISGLISLGGIEVSYNRESNGAEGSFDLQLFVSGNTFAQIGIVSNYGLGVTVQMNSLIKSELRFPDPVQVSEIKLPKALAQEESASAASMAMNLHNVAWYKAPFMQGESSSILFKSFLYLPLIFVLLAIISQHVDMDIVNAAEIFSGLAAAIFAINNIYFGLFKFKDAHIKIGKDPKWGPTLLTVASLVAGFGVGLGLILGVGISPVYAVLTMVATVFIVRIVLHLAWDYYYRNSSGYELLKSQDDSLQNSSELQQSQQQAVNLARRLPYLSGAQKVEAEVKLQALVDEGVTSADFKTALWFAGFNYGQTQNGQANLAKINQVLARFNQTPAALETLVDSVKTNLLQEKFATQSLVVNSKEDAQILTQALAQRLALSGELNSQVRDLTLEGAQVIDVSGIAEQNLQTENTVGQLKALLAQAARDPEKLSQIKLVSDQDISVEDLRALLQDRLGQDVQGINVIEIVTNQVLNADAVYARFAQSLKGKLTIRSAWIENWSLSISNYANIELLRILDSVKSIEVKGVEEIEKMIESSKIIATQA